MPIPPCPQGGGPYKLTPPWCTIVDMWFIALLSLFMWATGAAAQAPPAPAPVPSQGKRVVYESVVALEGKTIGTSILLEIGDTPDGTGGRPVTGWIQRNNFFPIDSGQADADKISFTSGGNQYDINLRTERINYSGRDGSGNQHIEKMAYVSGRIYKLTEEADEERTMTLQTDDGEKDFLVGEPTVWKHNGPPIDRFSRLEEVLGKTTGFWLTRMGSTRYIALMEEPAEMDLQKKVPKPPKKKK